MTFWPWQWHFQFCWKTSHFHGMTTNFLLREKFKAVKPNGVVQSGRMYNVILWLVAGVLSCREFRRSCHQWRARGEHMKKEKKKKTTAEPRECFHWIFPVQNYDNYEHSTVTRRNFTIRFAMDLRLYCIRYSGAICHLEAKQFVETLISFKFKRNRKSIWILIRLTSVMEHRLH